MGRGARFLPPRLTADTVLMLFRAQRGWDAARVSSCRRRWAWAAIAPHALHEAKTYAGWQREGQRPPVHTDAGTIEELKAGNVYRIVTPDECVELAHSLGPMGAIVLHPLMGGMPPALGWESLE